MLAYRIFPYLPSARPGQPGHATYLHKPQTGGRVDNPNHYDAFYMALSREAAVGEVFGDLPVWSKGMFIYPALPGSRRALATFRLPDDLPIMNLDDAKALTSLKLRPTEVVCRNLPVTQGWALRIFKQRNHLGARKWACVQWWSF
jgi:hypothetical protein